MKWRTKNIVVLIVLVVGAVLYNFVPLSFVYLFLVAFSFLVLSCAPFWAMLLAPRFWLPYLLFYCFFSAVQLKWPYDVLYSETKWRFYSLCAALLIFGMRYWGNNPHHRTSYRAFEEILLASVTAFLATLCLFCFLCIAIVHASSVLTAHGVLIGIPLLLCGVAICVNPDTSKMGVRRHYLRYAFISVALVFMLALATLSDLTMSRTLEKAQIIAGENPYCVQVPLNDRPVVSLWDVSVVRMASMIVRYGYGRSHALLHVMTKSGMESYHWSVWQGEFIKQNDDSRFAVCTPEVGFLAKMTKV